MASSARGCNRAGVPDHVVRTWCRTVSSAPCRRSTTGQNVRKPVLPCRPTCPATEETLVKLGTALLGSPRALFLRDAEATRERELKSREKERFGEHLLRPSLSFKPFVLLLVRNPHGTVLSDMVGLDRMAAGMDVAVATGWDIPRCVPRTHGSPRSAALETGGEARIADTVRVSRTRLAAADPPTRTSPPGKYAGAHGQ